MSFNFMAAITICSDSEAQENKVCDYFHCFPIYLHEVMVLDAMIFLFFNIDLVSRNLAVFVY